MNINSISKENSESVITLTSSELVTLCNVLYEKTVGESASKTALKLYADLMIARDLSQYGHIDAFCLERIIKCRERINNKE